MQRIVSILALVILSGQIHARIASHKCEPIVALVQQIQKADYDGNRIALKQLHDALTPPDEDKLLSSRVFYWRGFALWRRALNGFNETPTPDDLSQDLTQAIEEFKKSRSNDPSFIESKIGTISCLGNLIYLNRTDKSKLQDLVNQVGPIITEVQTRAPDNPRFLWVMGPIRWSSPAEHGGGQDAAFALYDRGLKVIRERKTNSIDPLEPTWGEPELLMNLAWSNLHRTPPDLDAANENALAALRLVPHWHYVRDILVPQIQVEKSKSKS